MLAAGGVWCVESRGWMEEGGAKCKSGGLEAEGWRWRVAGEVGKRRVRLRLSRG